MQVNVSRLIFCGNVNDDIYSGALGKVLTGRDSTLCMCKRWWALLLGATYLCGSHPVDGIWATSDLTVALYHRFVCRLYSSCGCGGTREHSLHEH